MKSLSNFFALTINNQSVSKYIVYFKQYSRIDLDLLEAVLVGSDRVNILSAFGF